MGKYELTERGKIVLALILVVLLLLIPSAIMALKAMAQTSPPSSDEDSGSYISPFPEPDPPVSKTTDSPPPTGGGFNPQDVSPQDVSTQDVSPQDVSPQDVSPTDGGLEPGKPDPAHITEPSAPFVPVYDPARVDSLEGTLSFWFFPGAQSMLDPEPMYCLQTFLSSPKNVSEAFIAIDMPLVPLASADELAFVVVGAFSNLGVQEQRLMFIMGSDEPEDEMFEVSMYYIYLTRK